MVPEEITKELEALKDKTKKLEDMIINQVNHIEYLYIRGKRMVYRAKVSM